MRAKHLARIHPDARLDHSVLTIIGYNHRVREPSEGERLLWSCPLCSKGIMDLGDNTGEAKMRMLRFQHHEKEHPEAGRMCFRKGWTAERKQASPVARRNKEAAMHFHRLHSGSVGEHELRPFPAARPRLKWAHKERVWACAKCRTAQNFWWYQKHDCQEANLFHRRLYYERLPTLAKKFPHHTKQQMWPTSDGVAPSDGV